MQPIKQLSRVLMSLADPGQALFSLTDLRAALPEHTVGAFQAVVTRAEKEMLLKRLCRGFYRYPRHQSGRWPAALPRRRPSARRGVQLHQPGVRPQRCGPDLANPMNRVTLMSSGRSTTLSCGRYGTIDFVHTKKGPAELADQLVYDPRCHLWRASVALACRT